MNFIKLTYPGVIITLLLYLANKRFNYKAKLVSLFGSTTVYSNVFISILTIFLFGNLLVTDQSPISSPLKTAVYFSILYLSTVPKDLR